MNHRTYFLAFVATLAFGTTNAFAAWTHSGVEQQQSLLEPFKYDWYPKVTRKSEACVPVDGQLNLTLLETSDSIDSSKKLPETLAAMLQVNRVERFTVPVEGYDYYDTDYARYLGTIKEGILNTQGECKYWQSHIFFGLGLGHFVGLREYLGIDTQARPAYELWRRLDIFLTTDDKGHESMIYVWKDDTLTRALEVKFVGY